MQPEAALDDRNIITIDIQTRFRTMNCVNIKAAVSKNGFITADVSITAYYSYSIKPKCFCFL